MATKLIKHKITIAGAGEGNTAKSYFFLAPKGTYNGEIATATGVAVAAANEQDEPTVTIKELLRTCRAIRINASAKSTGGKVYNVTMLCAAAKFSTIRDGLKGKAIATEGAASSGAVIFSVRGQTETNLS